MSDRGRQHRYWGLATLLIGWMLVTGAERTDAGVTANSGAAVLVYPYITVDNDLGLDTFIQLTNTKDNNTDVLCFYENTTAHCAGTANACSTVDDCAPGVACEAQWTPIPFQLHLFKQQPVSWRVSEGLSPILLPGSGSVPAAPEVPFVGALRCIVVDGLGAAVASNVLVGHATLEEYRPADDLFDVAKYNAIGLEAVVGDANADGHLLLGGAGLEYQGCANILILDHFFDHATEPVLRTSSVRTDLVLLPCSADYVNDIPGQSIVSYTVTNEFDTTATGDQTLEVTGQLAVSLNSPLLQVGTQGTLTGKMRLQATGAGVIAAVIEMHRDLENPTNRKSAARTVHGVGERISPDVIVLFTPQPSPTPTATPTGPTATPTPSPSPSTTRTTTQTPTSTPSQPAGVATATSTPAATSTPTSAASATPTSPPASATPTAGEGTPTVTPLTPTETPTVETALVGDLNHDHLVNAADLQLLIAEIFDGDGAAVGDAGGGTVPSGPEADVNDDGLITAADAVALEKIVQ